MDNPRARLLDPLDQLLTPTRGPGFFLRLIIPRLFSRDGCFDCDRYASEMNSWGVDGCRDRFEEIVEHLLEKAGKIGYLRPVPRSILRAKAVSWVTEAIDRAEADARQ